MDRNIKNWLEAEKVARNMSDLSAKLLRDAVRFAKIPGDNRLRPANPSDVKVGQIFWYKDGDEGPFWECVEEVMHPDAEHKAFMGYTGCRYGLRGAFVEIEDSRPLARNAEADTSCVDVSTEAKLSDAGPLLVNMEEAGFKDLVYRDERVGFECSIRKIKDYDLTAVERIEEKSIYLFEIKIGGEFVQFKTMPMYQSEARRETCEIAESLLSIMKVERG